MAARRPMLPEFSFLSTLGVTIGAITALYLIDTFLARTERAESGVEAARFYESGQRLMQEGKSAEAADQFKAALSSARDNQDYQLALGQALLSVGKLDDAEATLNDLLQRNPFSGPANLAMARVLMKKDRIDDATSYYHRAIYGHWKENARVSRVTVRFELADLLSHQESKEGLLAELLPLQDEAPNDVATREKLGHLFIAAGSPARGADIFRNILHKQSQDPEAHAGLGEAEFARGNYRAAQTELLAAIRLGPDDSATRARLDLCNRILQLDPMQRRLSLEEQYRRSRKLVEMVLDDVNQCLGTVPSRQALIEAVQNGLKKRVLPARLSTALEDNLDWADQLWQVRKMDCKHAIAPTEEPLALVLARLAQ